MRKIDGDKFIEYLLSDTQTLFNLFKGFGLIMPDYLKSKLEYGAHLIKEIESGEFDV